jgi:signal transduction histidine kinase
MHSPHFDAEHDDIEKQNNLLAMITHDLKSPMVAILGAADFLEESLENNTLSRDTRDSLQIIKSAGNDMLELIGNILTMARIETGKERIDPIRIDDLGHILNNITNTFKYEARINNITITKNIESNLPDVYWDMNKIHYHVINNIISNALKYTPAGGKVHISTEVRGAFVLIRISDNGPGISEVDRKRIFNRFERAMLESSRLYNSAGLGLYNAHLFVRKHNGTISISEGLENKGSCFTIKLPPHPFYPETGIEPLR